MKQNKLNQPILPNKKKPGPLKILNKIILSLPNIKVTYTIKKKKKKKNS